MSADRVVDEPRVSVVVATYNDLDNLQVCLASLAAQVPPTGGMEIVVVDDGSTDGTAEAVRRDYPDIIMVSTRNEGAELARNAGVDASKGEIVAFLDSDCTAPVDWLRRLADRLGDDRSLVVGGRILHRGSFWQRVTGIADFGEYQGPRERQVSMLPTCNMGLYRTWFDEVRFDPRMAPNADTLFASALGRFGARLLYDPEVMVIHRPAVDAASLFARARRYGRSFVAARRLDPALRYASLVRAGVPGVVVATLGRALLDWLRLLRLWRRAGFRPVEVPAAMAMLFARRLISVPEAVRAAREPMSSSEKRRR